MSEANQPAPMSDKARCLLLQEQNGELQKDLMAVKLVCDALERKWRRATIALATVEHSIAEFRSEQ